MKYCGTAKYSDNFVLIQDLRKLLLTIMNSANHMTVALPDMATAIYLDLKTPKNNFHMKTL